MTTNTIMEPENKYDPILQKYANQNYESQVQKFEKDTMVDTLAKNKVRKIGY